MNHISKKTGTLHPIDRATISENIVYPQDHPTSLNTKPTRLNKVKNSGQSNAGDADAAIISVTAIQQATKKNNDCGRGITQSWPTTTTTTTTTANQPTANTHPTMPMKTQAVSNAAIATITFTQHIANATTENQPPTPFDRG
jgi:hypothetical protein